MSTVYQSIVSLAVGASGLNALIAGRIYAVGSVPQQPVAPYVVFQKISTKDYKAMGRTINKTYRFQFDCYAVTRAAAQALLEQLEAALDYQSGGNIVACLSDGGMDDVTALDQNAQFHRSQRDFMITI